MQRLVVSTVWSSLLRTRWPPWLLPPVPSLSHSFSLPLSIILSRSKKALARHCHHDHGPHHLQDCEKINFTACERYAVQPRHHIKEPKQKGGSLLILVSQKYFEDHKPTFFFYQSKIIVNQNVKLASKRNKIQITQYTLWCR